VRVRFLMTTASMIPDVPFQAGQIIDLPMVTDAVRAWLTDGRAELVPESREAATLAPPPSVATDRAVQRKGRR
jgi:hypothetical protein